MGFGAIAAIGKTDKQEILAKRFNELRPLSPVPTNYLAFHLLSDRVFRQCGCLQRPQKSD
jgi:hypothetical protein